MRWNYIGFTLLLFVVCAGNQVESKTLPVEANMGYDRVCIMETSMAFTSAKADDDAVIRPFHYWEMGRLLESTPNGMEHIQLENGKDWWVSQGVFYPVYVVTDSTGADLLVAFNPEDKYDPTIKPHEIKVERHLAPGTILGVSKMAQALSGTYSVVLEDETSGYVAKDRIKPVGNSGPY